MMTGIIETFFLAMTPIGELRASLPIALTVHNMNWFLAFVISVLGNLVPVVFILLFLGPVSEWLSSNFSIFKRFFDWVFERTRRKAGRKIERYGDIALVSFVAVPLPLTGAWTGALAAFLFGISPKRAFPLISLGVIISGIIVLLLTSLGVKFFA